MPATAPALAPPAKPELSGRWNHARTAPKLTKIKVQFIRDIARRSSRKKAEICDVLARRYHVSVSTVWDILSSNIWKPTVDAEPCARKGCQESALPNERYCGKACWMADSDITYEPFRVYGDGPAVVPCPANDERHRQARDAQLKAIHAYLAGVTW